MTNDEIINLAFLELKGHSKLYMMFKEFSLLTDREWSDDEFQKVRFLLIKSKVFEKHTDHAFKFSELGVEITSNYNNWFDYKKSLKEKPDYVKWAGLVVSILLLAWNIYQGIKNSKLETENTELKKQIEEIRKK